MVHFDLNLAFTEYVEQMVTNAGKGIAAIRVMAAPNCEQCHLILLYQIVKGRKIRKDIK